MKSPFHHIKHAHKTFDHFHENLHHAFVIIVAAMIGMLRGASQLMTPNISKANRQWGGFITNDFWTQSPDEPNIKYALFGNGTAGSTAYTRLWSSSCVPSNLEYLSSGFVGGTLSSDTIYIIDSGNYVLTNPITMSGCSALIGRGDVTITSTSTLANPLLSISAKNNIILDNIALNGNNTIQKGTSISSSSNVSANNIIVYNNVSMGYYIIQSHYIQINNSKFFNNNNGILFSNNTKFSINNSLIYNNSVGIMTFMFGNVSINNSQIFNNTTGAFLVNNVGSSINNSIFYNNNEGIHLQGGDYISNNISSYNNNIGLTVTGYLLWPPMTTGTLTSYGATKIFNNTTNTSIASGNSFSLGSTSPTGLSRSAGLLNTGSITLNYNRVTNPQNSNGQSLLSGTDFTVLRGKQGFTSTQAIRYIFGIDILKQKRPVRYNGSAFNEYGTNSADYFTTRYIAEPESSLALEDQELVEQYFGSGSTFTENWESNGCSLSAFQVETLDPGTYTSSNNTFEDHTIYILTGGEYITSVTAGNGFVFNGNCVALIGNEDTRFTKSGGGISSVLYANDKRNIIIDGIKVDGMYYANSHNGPAHIGIKLDGTTNNSTLNNIQVYNNADYGIYLGLGSSYITLMNIQAFNNSIAGIYLYYASIYNVINNIQTYNNVSYGIWFANGSSRNTINNFQSYNNAIGVFGDLTTSENVINKAAIYNNSSAGIYFKNSSGNMMNDVRIYNNQRGIKTLYNSPNNQFYGNFELYNNLSGNFDGTDANDGTLFAGAGLFAYPGTIYTGNVLVGCSYATNPLLSTTSGTLLTGTCNNIGRNGLFVSPYNKDIQYIFGLNMHKQSVPVRYTSLGSLLEVASQYDASKYIAERFAIRDETPENVSFVSSGNIALSTRYTSEVYTAATINTTIDAELALTPSTTSGYLIIDGQNVGLTGTVENGDTVEIAFLTATGYNEVITGTVTLGTVSTGFTVTTKNYNQTPNTGSLAFTNFTSLEINILTGSTTTVAGLETGVYASIDFAPSTTLGWLEIYSGGSLINSGSTGLLVYNGNQIKSRAQSSSSYGSTVTGSVTIGLGTGAFTLTTKGGDIVAPSTPTVTYPLSGEYMFFVNFDWEASTDTGSGIEGYTYEIASDSSFMDITHDGFISTETGTSGSPDTDFTTVSGRRYFRIKARDRDGNYSNRSNTGSFRILPLVDRELSEITGANLISYYTSDILEVKGISSGVSLRASVSSNALLYKNGEERGTGAYVQNDDLLYLKIRSSNNYNTIKTGTMTIANRLVEFNVRTKTSAIYGCTLSDDDRENIEAIFDSMVDNYINNTEQYEEFLYTMQSMLEDEINFNNNCNLMYLQDLVRQALGLNQVIISTETHIAPNCKEYEVSYDIDNYTYTSPTLVHPIYFANRDTLTKYIDSKNAGDCHINTYGASSRYFTNNDPNKHIAPNGKIYPITMEAGKYTSDNFITQKYFSSLSELRTYIDKNNMPSNVWNHQVDTTFTPQIYTAPNAKEYKIYRTNRGYMSYKLLKVQYFGSLSEIQYYIKINNPN